MKNRQLLPAVIAFLIGCNGISGGYIWAGTGGAGLYAAEAAVTKSVIVTGEKAAPLSMGQYISQANLIVVGEYKADGHVAVQEVLKGDKSFVGKTIALSSQIFMGCRRQPVPPIKTAAVLIHAGAKGSSFRADEIFDMPDQLAVLHLFVPIYANPSEHDRLAALSKLFFDAKARGAVKFEADPQPVFKREFVWALGQMRDPANFALVEEIYSNNSLNTHDKLSLLEWIAGTGDRRALPVLIASLKSDRPQIASDAASKLIYYYPGLVTDNALRSAFPKLPRDVRPMVAAYLIGCGHGTPEMEKFSEPQTPFQKAEKLSADGKIKEANAIYLSIIESTETSNYVVMASMQKVLAHSGQHARERILKSRLSWLKNCAATGNYLEAAEVAEILRDIKDPACLEALESLLARRDFLFAKAERIATMGIFDLGAAARKQAVQKLLQERHGQSVTAGGTDNRLSWLLEFAWLMQQPEREALAKAIAGESDWSATWKSIDPLMQGLPAVDEGLYLTHVLKSDSHLPQAAIEWIIYRLGDLHEKRAVSAIVARLEKDVTYSPQIIIEALESIGGDEVAKQMQMIAEGAESPAQGAAIDIYANIKKEQSLPVLRKVLKIGSLDAKVHALNAMGRFGSATDRAYLMPMFDYWTGDRSVHYWVLQAMAGINSRHH